MNEHKDQLAAIIAKIEREPTHQFDEDFLRDLFGPVRFGQMLAAQAIYSDDAEDEVAEARKAAEEPAAVRSYRDRLGTYLAQHRTMSNRLPKLLQQLDALLRRVKSHEDFLGDEGKWEWAAYDRLSEEEKRWCQPAPQNRTPTNLPKVYSQATWEVVFPDRPTFRNQAIKALAEHLLKD